MTELHDQDCMFDEVPPYEPDWHQQDKDDRAQGMHLDPEPPDDEPPPSLDVIEELHAVSQSGGRFSPFLHKALGYREDQPDTPGEAVDLLLREAVPQLLAQLRAAQAELEEWRALPYRDEFGVYHAGSEDTEGSRAYSHDPVSALFSAKHFGGTPQTRRIYTGPWVELQEAPY